MLSCRGGLDGLDGGDDTRQKLGPFGLTECIGVFLRNNLVERVTQGEHQVPEEVIEGVEQVRPRREGIIGTVDEDKRK